MDRNHALEGWFSGIDEGDDAALEAVLDENVTFQSPVMNTPQVGRAIALKYLQIARQVLVTPDFSYTERWDNSSSAVLEFEARVDGLDVNGVDIIRWNDDRTAILGIKVMVRPLRALEALKTRMAELLAPSETKR